MQLGGRRPTFPVLVTTALLIVYVAAATAHAIFVNVDVARWDQDLYLQGARDLRTSEYAWPTNRAQMPLYLYFLSTFHDPRRSLEGNFLAAKLVNVTLSVAVLACIHALVGRALPRAEARLFTATAAFTLFVVRAGYVQVELLFYGLAFAAFVAMGHAWETRAPGAALLAGALAAVAHLAKGSLLPGFAVFVGLFAARSLRDTARALAARRRLRAEAPGKNGRGHRSFGGALLGSVLAPLAFLTILFPYLHTSKRQWGGWFFNLNSTYAMWCDSWDAFRACEQRLGDWGRWHTLPASAGVPTLTRYVGTHGITDTAVRITRGLAEVLFNAWRSGYAPFLALALLFTVGARPRPRVPAAPLVIALTLVYLLLLGFYGAVMAGSRFVSLLFLPLFFACLHAAAATRGVALTVFARRVDWPTARALLTFALALHVLFRMPETMLHLAGG